MRWGPKQATEGVRGELALRATLRAFAGIFGLNRGDGPTYSRAELGQITIALVRTVIVHWIASAYGGVESDRLSRADAVLRDWITTFDERRPRFYKENIISSDYMVGAREQDLEGARRVLALASGIGGEPLPAPFDLQIEHPAPYVTFSLFGPEAWAHGKRWVELLRESIRSDEELLERMSLADLVLAPLWANPAGDALEVHLGERDWSGLAYQGWIHSEVVAFLRERRGGVLVLGNPPDEMAERMRAIAALPDEFWEDRLAEDLNENLAYCFHGDMENAAWGAPKPSLLRQSREHLEAYSRGLAEAARSGSKSSDH
jgi:hypothetical protein